MSKNIYLSNSMNFSFWVLVSFFLSSGCVQDSVLVNLGYQFQESGWVAGGRSSFSWLHREIVNMVPHEF